MSNDRNHYIYIWKEQGIDGSSIPFYVGQGKHMYGNYIKKYYRAYAFHKRSFAQDKANKLAKLGTPHIVDILHDNLTKTEADYYEKLLISRLGRRNIGTGILCNLTDGGDFNPMECPEIAKKQLEYMKSEENKNRASKHSKKLWQDPIYRKSQLDMNKLEKVNNDRKIRIEIDGVEYPSIQEAALKNNINPGTLRKRMLNGLPLNKDSSYYNPIIYNGIEYRNSADLARKLNINYNTLKSRQRSGVSLESAINKGLSDGKR